MMDPFDWFLLDQVVFPGILSGTRVFRCEHCGKDAERDSSEMQICCECGNPIQEVIE